jgi:hypothetical protein
MTAYLTTAKNHEKQLMRKRGSSRRGCSERSGVYPDTVKMATCDVRGCQSGEV